MKKNIKENKTTKMIDEISGILDNDYFCINVTQNENFRYGIEWTVYYKNLKTDDYYSDRNKPILTSRKNTIADIYILKDILEKLKKETIEDVGFDFFSDNMKIYYLIKEVKDILSLGMLDIFTIYTIANIVIVLIANNFIISIINFVLCILGAIYFIFKKKKTDKLLDEAEEIKKKILLKNLIKGQGLEFVRKIRKELHNRGVYKYGTNKETRKTIE